MLQEMLRHKSGISNPRVIFGDFNVVRCAIKKKGRQSICQVNVGEFNKWVDDTEVLEISSVGRLYT